MRGRDVFAALGRSSQRGASGPVRVRYLPPEPGDAAVRVAYSVPKKVGGAVERNLYRRRLRAISGEHALGLAVGTYLVSVDPRVAGSSYGELRQQVIEAMQRANGRSGR